MCKGNWGRGGVRVYKAWFSLGEGGYQVVKFEGQFCHCDYFT